MFTTHRRTSRGPVEELRSLPLFAGCTRRELQRIDSLLTQLRVREGSQLLRPGTGLTQLVLVTDGVIGVRDGDDVSVLGRGEVIGHDRRVGASSLSVVTLSDVTMLVAGVADVAELRRIPSVARGLAEAFDRARSRPVTAPPANVTELVPRAERTKAAQVAILVCTGVAPAA